MEKDDTLTLQRASNGIIVKHFVWNEALPTDAEGNDNYYEQVTLIEEPEEGSEDDTDYSKKLLFKKLAEYLLENYFYIYNDKYGKNNISIEFKKGHKLE